MQADDLFIIIIAIWTGDEYELMLTLSFIITMCAIAIATLFPSLGSDLNLSMDGLTSMLVLRCTSSSSIYTRIIIQILVGRISVKHLQEIVRFTFLITAIGIHSSLSVPLLFRWLLCKKYQLSLSRRPNGLIRVVHTFVDSCPVVR